MVYKALLAKQGLLGERLQVKENICIIVKDGIIENILDKEAYERQKPEGCEETEELWRRENIFRISYLSKR